ncbi:hypothetical protein DFH09DRAFT_1328831 [Mycena vulgaris]|nr:hypothetical protein DFH09DRAFT_1328831 [Mycena vulgaris]
MATSIPGSLSSSDEAIVRRLFKVVRATKFEDPVDQAAFLADSATTVLRYRLRPDSFALVPELADCVFTIRSMMHANRAHLPTSPSAVFTSLQDFAGEIVRKRQLFQERQRVNADRARAASGIADRIARNAALQSASKEAVKSPSSPGCDTVSIPSSCDESGIPDLQTCTPSLVASPIKTEPDLIRPSSQAVPLSPLYDLPIRLSRLSLSTPHPVPPSSPLSSGRSLPDLVPDFVLASTPYARPSRPMQYAAGGATPLRPATPASEAELRQRLAAVQAELRRYASAQKELFWQLQTLHQFESAHSSCTSQED